MITTLVDLDLFQEDSSVVANQAVEEAAAVALANLDQGGLKA